MSADLTEKISLADLQEMFSFCKPETVGNLPDFEALGKLRYRRLTSVERDNVILRVLKDMDGEALAKSGASRHSAWERGWAEILEAVETHGLSYEILKPQYFRHGIMRFCGDYIGVEGESFEFLFCHLLKLALYREFLAENDKVVELGCGTGANIYLMLRLFPEIDAIGCDWAEPAQRIVARIAEALGARARGVNLDLFTLEGVEAIGDLEDAVVLTIHALEQLGTDFQPVLDLLLNGKPRLCIHVEPIEDFYDRKNLFDYLGCRYHTQRAHLSGFWPALARLEQEERIEILHARRIPLGNVYHEPYSVIVWRPQ
jgi:SAM-dependent methyltransferase